MSRPTYAPKESYLGDGSLASYTFDFKIEALTQLLVVVLDDNGEEVERVRGDDAVYLDSVIYDNLDGGGTVLLKANLPTNYKIYLILSNDAPTQPYEFRNKGAFTLRMIENALDFILGAVQRLAMKGKQAFRIHDTDDETAFDGQFPPDVVANAERYIKINDAGDGVEYGFTEDELAAAVLPAGGDTGAILDKVSPADGDIQWNQHAYDGYSVRFNEPFSSANLTETVEKILDLSYIGPLVSLAAAGSATIREKGDPVNSTLLSANVTKTTDPLARIEFKKDGLSIDDNNPPGDLGSHVEQYNHVTPFSDDAEFTVEVTDDGASGGPTTTIATDNFVFVHPYYSGAGAVGLTPAQVAALTKDIAVSNPSVNKAFTALNGEVFYFAYPASYGPLTSILDENDFETFSDWTLTVADITGLDAAPISYNIYEFNNPVIAGTTNYTFVR